MKHIEIRKIEIRGKQLSFVKYLTVCYSILGVLQKSPNSSNQPGEIIIPTLQMRDQGSCGLSKVIQLESSLARFDA